MAAMAVKERLNLSGVAKITVLKELANKAGLEFGPVGSAQHEIDWMGRATEVYALAKVPLDGRNAVREKAREINEELKKGTGVTKSLPEGAKSDLKLVVSLDEDPRWIRVGVYDPRVFHEGDELEKIVQHARQELTKAAYKPIKLW